MGFAAIAAGVGAAATAAGTVVSVIGQQDAAAASKKAEATRSLQMNLDAARSRRDIARKAMMTQSQALATATAQGAQDGSGAAGGQAQIFGQAGEATEAVNQNQQLGQQIFKYNADLAGAQSLTSFGQGLSQFGSSLNQNKDMLGRVGSYLGSKV